MNPEDIILGETRQTEKDKYHDITYMWNLKQTNKQTPKLIYTEEKLVVFSGGGRASV